MCRAELRDRLVRLKVRIESVRENQLQQRAVHKSIDHAPSPSLFHQNRYQRGLPLLRVSQHEVDAWVRRAIVPFRIQNQLVNVLEAVLLIQFMRHRGRFEIRRDVTFICNVETPFDQHSSSTTPLKLGIRLKKIQHWSNDSERNVGGGGYC